MKIEDLEFNIKRLRLEPGDIVVLTFDENDMWIPWETLEELRIRVEEQIKGHICMVLSNGGRIYTLRDAGLDEAKERWSQLEKEKK